MNNELQNKLSQLEGLIKIQHDCLEKGYMHGMLNGLICAHAVIAKVNPEYVSLDRNTKNNIRHKARKNAKIRDK